MAEITCAQTVFFDRLLRRAGCRDIYGYVVLQVSCAKQVQALPEPLVKHTCLAVLALKVYHWGRSRHAVPGAGSAIATPRNAIPACMIEAFP